MGVSLYYAAEREQMLSGNEAQAIAAIMQKFNATFDFKDEAESFDYYEYDQDQPTVILKGATKIPLHLEQDQMIASILH